MKTKKPSTASLVREVLESYRRGQLFTLQDDITRTGLIYDIEKKLGKWPSEYAVKKALSRMNSVICGNRVKSIWQKK